MICEIDYMLLVKLLQAYDYDIDTAETVADYLTECVEYTLDLYKYIWNTLPYYVHIFESKEEVDEHIKHEGLDRDDCTIFKSDNGFYYFQSY